MEASSASNRIGGRGLGQLVASRRGGTILAIAAAALAAILLYVFVDQYRKHVDSNNAATPVFVASGFIPHGTPASVISSQSLLQRTTVKHSTLLAGAVTDPTQIEGGVVVKDIAPGQQLQISDFAAGNPTLSSYLTGTGRAIALPVDSSHGLTGYVSPGDHVDVLWSATGGTAAGVTTVAQDVSVIALGGGGGGGIGGGSSANEVIVKVTDKQALSLALAADTGKVWIVLRPAVGGQSSIAVGQKAK